MYTKTVACLVLSVALATPAQAATVHLVPTSPVQGLVAGDLVTADIVLNFPDVASLAYGVNIFFSPNLEYVSYTDAGLGDPGLARSPEFVAPGHLESAATASLDGLPQFGVVASITFRYLYRAPGFIELDHVNWLAGPPWISADDYISLIPVTLNRLDYRVPLPSAVWLLCSALLAGCRLASRTRRYSGPGNAD